MNIPKVEKDCERSMKAKLKINILLPSFYLSGGARVAAFYAQEFVKKGHDVICYAPHTLCNPALMRNVKYQAHRIGRYILNSINNKFLKEIQSFYQDVEFKDVKRLSDRFIRDADITIATSWPTAYYLQEMSASKGEKVYLVQGFETWGGKKAAEMCLKTYKSDLHKIVVSEWINQRLIENGCPTGYIIHNGIDTSMFNNEHKKYSKSINCLMLDNPTEIKGVRFGIEAFLRAKQIHGELRLTMFGMEKSEFVPDGFEYHQAVKGSDLVRLYQNADIFIFPSLAEGWGLTPIEAMACKCAVVATNTGCMVEIGENEKNVLLSEPKDVELMARNICRLVENRSLLESISEEGYKSVQNLDWSNSVNLFDEYLQNLLGNYDKNSYSLDN